MTSIEKSKNNTIRLKKVVLVATMLEVVFPSPNRKKNESSFDGSFFYVSDCFMIPVKRQTP